MGRWLNLNKYPKNKPLPPSITGGPICESMEQGMLSYVVAACPACMAGGKGASLVGFRWCVAAYGTCRSAARRESISITAAGRRGASDGQ